MWPLPHSKARSSPSFLSNSIQMLQLAVMLNIGVSLFTRLGFLHEIEKGTLPGGR